MLAMLCSLVRTQGLRRALLPATRVLMQGASGFKEIEGFQNQLAGRVSLSGPKFYARADESPDDLFYEEPRFVTHIDDRAIKSLSAYYAHEIHEGADMLDICSSCISRKISSSGAWLAWV